MNETVRGFTKLKEAALGARESFVEMGVAAAGHRVEAAAGGGWRCVRCGGESMDMMLLAGVSCE